jgi:hypothetical protein
MTRSCSADTGRTAAARGVVGVVGDEAPWQLDAWAARIAAGADALRVVASVWPEALDGPAGPIARGLRSGDVVPGSTGLLTIAVGRRADLCVTDLDPATVSTATLHAVPVAGTLLGGRWTHRAGIRPAATRRTAHSSDRFRRKCRSPP